MEGSVPQRTDLKNEGAWARRMELEEAVLVHLAENSSAKMWGRIYSRFFQDGIGEVGEALGRLAHCRYIAVDADGTARKTPCWV